MFKMEQVEESHICVHETIFLCQMDHFLLIKKTLIALCVKYLLSVIWLLHAWRHMALTCLLMECPQPAPSSVLSPTGWESREYGT